MANGLRKVSSMVLSCGVRKVVPWSCEVVLEGITSNKGGKKRFNLRRYDVCEERVWEKGSDPRKESYRQGKEGHEIFNGV